MRRDEPEDDSPGMMEERVVDDFLTGSPRAEHLEEMCESLRVRIRSLKDYASRTTDDAERIALEDRIRTARQQLAVLKQEQAISRFVEDSVRATLRAEPSAKEYDLDEEW